MRFEAARTY